MRRPTRSPFHRPAMQTLERLHSELGGQILENKTEALKLADQMRPGTSERLIPGWLEDPEFRFEAVAAALTEADALARDPGPGEPETASASAGARSGHAKRTG